MHKSRDDEDGKQNLKISELVAGLTSIDQKDDRVITGICSDSREVKTGNCFFALKGLHQDGRNFIPDALKNGASVVIVDENFPYCSPLPVPVIHVPDLTSRLGEIAARFYRKPAKDLLMIGVTGTNGKTSTSQFIAMALHMAKSKCAVMGTLGYGYPGHLSPSMHTTADPLTLQRHLFELSELGAEAVAMEVSSHALAQYRTSGIKFDMAIFTNLTRDHLDFHGDMDNYAAAKRKLFYTEGLKYAVINTDDPFGFSLAKELKNKLSVYCYGSQTNQLDLPMTLAHHIHLNTKGITARISSPWGEGQLRSRLLGRFNLSNLLAVLTALLILELPFDTALDYLSQLSTVPGRMQCYGGGKLPLVVVDYAHTPDALMQVLVALQEHTQGKLWCLFGCGGDRDKGKRPLMGQIAERYADQLMLTDDNPRTEDSAEIVADITSGLLCPWAAEIEHDRGAAIAHVISCAKQGDVVLVAGKGHETCQIIGEEKIPFNDSEHIQNQLRLKAKNST